jgi:hypothetical protein
MNGRLGLSSGPERVATCVILTRACHFSDHAGPACGMVARPGKSVPPKKRRLRTWAIGMSKETTPLWVWLSVALLAIGAATYVTTVYLIEYIM